MGNARAASRMCCELDTLRAGALAGAGAEALARRTRAGGASWMRCGVIRPTLRPRWPTFIMDGPVSMILALQFVDDSEHCPISFSPEERAPS